MIDMQAVLAVFTVYIVGVVIPGPNFVAVAHKAVSARRSEAFALVAGIVLVNLFWASSALLGVGIIFALFPLVGASGKSGRRRLFTVVRLSAYRPSGAFFRPLHGDRKKRFSRRLSAGHRHQHRQPQIYRLLRRGVFVGGACPCLHAHLRRHAAGGRGSR